MEQSSPMSRVEVSVVAFQEGDLWVAQCVEFDIAAHASDLTKLHAALERAVIQNICINTELGRQGLDGIDPAPERFKALFERSEIGVRRRARPSRARKANIVRIRELRLTEVSAV
jgi:hypothetical protein